MMGPMLRLEPSGPIAFPIERHNRQPLQRRQTERGVVRGNREPLKYIGPSALQPGLTEFLGLQGEVDSRSQSKLKIGRVLRAWRFVFIAVPVTD